MSSTELFKRYLVFIGALLVNSAGIVFLTDSGLGTSQISSLPYVASFILPLTLGSATFIINTLFVLIQIPILGKEFRKRYLLQIPVTLLFSVFIDILMFLCRNLAPGAYAGKLALCLIGCVVLAFGVCLEVVCDVTVLPGEGIVSAISRRTGWDFGVIKTVFDLSLVLTSIVISWIFLRKIAGIREGTVIAALIVGSLVRFFRSKMFHLVHWFTLPWKARIR